jgi:DNA transformation protein and related proteins
MPVQPQYLAYVLEQLAALSAVRSNRMFGGVGLYSDGLFFGLIDDDTLYFKTSPENIEQYRSRNMPKFMPFPDKTGAVMGYHQVPADVIEDTETLVAWARQSLAVALAWQAKKAAKKAPEKAPADKPAARKKTAKKKAAVPRNKTKLKSKPSRAAATRETSWPSRGASMREKSWPSRGVSTREKSWPSRGTSTREKSLPSRAASTRAHAWSGRKKSKP